MLRRNFEQLVVEEKVEALLERKLGVGGELDGAVGGVGAHICKLLFAADVIVEVVLFIRKTDNHTFIDIDARGDEENATSLSGVEGVSGGGAGLRGDQSTITFGLIFSSDGLIAGGDTRHDYRALGGGQEMIAQADQGGSGDFISEARGAGGGHILRLEFGAADAQLLRNSTDKFGVNFDSQILNRFLEITVGLTINNLGAANFELKTLATHSFDQDGEVKLATTRNFVAEAIRRNLESDISF